MLNFLLVPPPGVRRVIIIGAGLSGLACAHELSASATTSSFSKPATASAVASSPSMTWCPENIVEAGGELIGSNHPTWIAYATKFNLTFAPILRTKISPPR